MIFRKTNLALIRIKQALKCFIGQQHVSRHLEEIHLSEKLTMYKNVSDINLAARKKSHDMVLKLMGNKCDIVSLRSGNFMFVDDINQRRII